MNWVGRLFRRQRLERELDVELRDHLERLVGDYVREGMSESDARRRARLEFGGLEQTKELCRDARGTRRLEDLAQDLRHGVRMLAKAPGFAAAAILTLALGTGANLAIFTLVDALLMRPLPVHEPHQLVVLSKLIDGQPSEHFSYPQVQRLAHESELFTNLAGFGSDTLNVGPVDALEPVGAAWVNGAYYATLGLAPAVGRLLGPSDDTPGAPPAAVITHEYWTRRFAGDPATVGRPLLIEGMPVPIIGVAPKGFSGVRVGERPDITLAIQARPQLQPERADSLGDSSRWLAMLARPRPDLSPDQLRSRLQVVWTQLLETTTPATLTPEVRQRMLAAQIVVRSGGTGSSAVRERFRQPLLASMALVTIVLLIACVNVANLLLARATFRQREVALRLAIGASRGRIFRQLIAESALLSVGGVALGVVLASIGSRALFALVAGMRVGPDVEGITLDLSPDWRVLAFTTLLAVTTTALFGALPSLRSGREEPMRAMQAGSARLAHSRGRLGATLVTVQVALSLLLLISAGLFGQTVRNLRTLERGFRHEGVLVVGLDHSRTGRTGRELSAFLQEIVSAVERVPGVQSVSLSAITPLQGGGISQAISMAGQAMEPVETYYNNVGPRFFEVLGTPMILGREFTPQDEAASDGVAIVNEAFVRRYMPDVDPLGQRLEVAGYRVGGAARELRVVGVVRDAAYETLRAAPPPTVYGPYTHRSPRAVALVVHAPGALAAVSSAILRDVQPKLGGRLVRMKTLTAQLEGSLTRERLMAVVASVFGSLALMLAALGVYGLLAYWVARSTREIGIRLALGARRSTIVREVIGDALRMVVYGAAAGLAAALALSRFIASMMFGLTSSDPITIGAALIVLLLAGLVAGWFPARRATRVNPVTALRAE